jgi:hypothetical protein
VKIAVIGCGPAGLAAAHAAHGLGAGVVIYSPGEKSPQRGPLVLQRPIPAISTDHPDGYIKQLVIGGSILDYRYKLYGDINISIQGNILQEGYHCWKFIETYDRLWDLYMTPGLGRAAQVLTMINSEEISHMVHEFSLVINTAPLSGLCYQGHTFRSKVVEITMERSYPNQPEDTTIFNAGNYYPWVRSAWLLGNECTEWLPGTVPDGLESITIRKPIGHNCDCYPDMLLTGRFGAWRNETWVDTAYYDTRDALISTLRKSGWDRVQ